MINPFLPRMGLKSAKLQQGGEENWQEERAFEENRHDNEKNSDEESPEEGEKRKKKTPICVRFQVKME
uniref:Uncharacterized protein n=1 Tax=Salarias fasciatus TaxID=181472 RepID=A0A672G303_SALFA